MNEAYTKGLYFGSLKDFYGQPIVEEGNTTNGEFVPISGTRIKIRVDNHPPGGPAKVALILEHGDGDTFSRFEEMSEGSAYFGFSNGPRGLAFTHEKSH